MGAEQRSPTLEFVQQPFAVDVETKRLAGRMEVSAINKQHEFFWADVTLRILAVGLYRPISLDLDLISERERNP